jgi:hypothetical protein
MHCDKRIVLLRVVVCAQHVCTVAAMNNARCLRGRVISALWPPLKIPMGLWGLSGVHS